MTLYQGMNIDLKVRGTDGLSRKIITDAGCEINLYAPPKNPKLNVMDRVTDHVVTATYDPVTRFYIASVTTIGWAVGTWWMQGVLTGGVENYAAWDYESFVINP